jgi:splicing factor U2AF subunit
MPITQQATRHARRIYVGGLPPGSNEGIVATFFSNALAAIGGTQPMPGDPVLNVYMNQEKKFGFVEFRTVEETSNAMALDGVLMEGVTLRVRRPNDYNPAVAATLGPSGPSPILNITAIGLEPGKAGSGGGGGGGSAEDQGNRLFVGGLPYFLTEAMVRELVEAFGPVKSFQLVVDRETGNSKGYGFFVYVDQSVTDVACQGLHGMKMGDKVLTVRRATTQGSVKPGGASTAIVPPPIYGGVLPAMGQEGWMPGMGPMSGVAGMPGTYAMPDQSAMFAQVQAHLAGAGGAGAPGAAGVDGVAAGAPGVLPPAANPESTVLSLTDMLDVEELRDDTEYAEITEDMKEECGKYGAVLSMVIPRPPAPGSVEHVPGLGKVFVQFADVVGATAARSALHGRKFGGQIVKADYLAEGAFVAQAFS